MILYFLLSFLIAVIAVPYLIRFSEKRKMMDFSEGDNLKIHKDPRSFFGGLDIFAALIISLLIYDFSNLKTFFLAAAFLIVFLLGLWDDFNWKHISKRKPFTKLIFLIICSLASAAALYFAQIRFFALPILIAAFYIFVLINAVNYQDGMDGQAGALFFISIVGFFILSMMSGNNLTLFICSVSFGAVLGFLIYNFPPAKIFMGDSGAYLLGIILAALAVSFSGNIFSHIFIIGLPLFDGVIINLVRLVKGQSIFLGDREHFYDKLLKRGFSVKQTLIISSALQLIFVLVGVLIYYLHV